MYRVKVQNINGSKVYAGGKWLQCIGNISPNVGEYVWTDGRCVYGRNNTPQQPLIITEPEPKEIIPIMTYQYPYSTYDDIPCNCYIFQRRKLKPIDNEDEDEDDNINPYERIMINDEKSAVFIIYAPFFIHYILEEVDSSYYGHYYIGNADFVLDTEEDSEIYTLAANIKSGNLFTIVLQNNAIIAIQKTSINTEERETIKEIDLRPVLYGVRDDCPTGDELYFPGSANDHLTHSQLILRWGFIEDEKKWAFLVEFATNKWTRVADVPANENNENLEPDNPIEYTGPGYFYSVAKDIYFTPEGHEIIRSATASTNSETGEPSSYSEETHTVKFLLQDGYYFTTTPFHYEYQAEIVPKGTLGEIDIFSPRGSKIFSGFFYDLYPRLSFCKIKNGYLIGCDNSAHEYGTKEIDSQLVIVGGLFLYREENLEMLTDKPCINQRLRPMKKYKKWHERTKEIESKQVET